ncbi:MAG: L-rhamnose mutarotase [Mucilaginibacter sp.]|uniref:L-rhamnose mutarotase n=1 Tax=Mucilaginibacter sp. TaxID=1882438 RepID=UPI0031A58233
MKSLVKHIWKHLALVVAVLLLFNVSSPDAITNPFSIVEIIAPSGKMINKQALLRITSKQSLPASAVYQWKNHLVVYGKNLSITALQKDIKMAYPKCGVKIYSNPFYDFDKKQQCANTQQAKQWDNIILTANLVNDQKLQQEYLNYHATQFIKWPEVAKGFCNANFQQLLVFKNGRQLMLVISIPRGESLDKLNPKTSENNPRVDEWNKLMAKYQEGIPGTKNGEVWVFFSNKLINQN